MKILLISDSHGHYSDIQRAVDLENPEHIFYMGDGVEDLEKIKFNGKIDAVLGNNDYNLDYPLVKIINLYNYKIMLTHGHKFFVPTGIKIMAEYAKEQGANLVIFGHTHHRFDEIVNGIRCINPGCICGQFDKYLSYAVLNLNNNTVEIEFKEL